MKNIFFFFRFQYSSESKSQGVAQHKISDMVQKKSVEWQHTENLTTPSQKRLYMESCKNWLLAVPEDAVEIEVKRQEMPIAIESQRSENIGVVKEQIHLGNRFSCFVCGKEDAVQDGRVLNANPFARAQCMIVCTNCRI
tara:strand:+ start:320 stop:736 length:417 start_codon:yes stop_codon:yes gene_type:complete